MSSTAVAESSYALGHSERELDRLSRQAQAFEPFTRQLFREAGLEKGMRVLDVGCGSGDVALLAAEMVGPDGEVVGTDRASAAVDRANSRAKARGLSNAHFIVGDPLDLRFERAFDAVVGRLVLMYYPDPVTAVRKLSDQVKSSGLIVFQEFDEQNCRSLPPVPTFECAVGWIKQTLERSGAHSQTGMKLYSILLAAGLPAPRLRMDALVGGGVDPSICGLVAEAVASFLPAMERLKVATREQVGLPTLLRRIQDEVLALRATIVSPALIGAWARRR